MHKLTLNRIAELRASNSNGTLYQDCSASERYELFDLAERALKAPRLTREQAYEMHNKVMLDGDDPNQFLVRLHEYGIEVESAPPEAKV